MILFEIKINDKIQYLSFEPIALDKWYAPYVIGFSPIQYRIGKLFGGFISPQWGEIELSQEVFIEAWPPPVKIEIIIKVGDEQEVEFEGIGYLSSFNRESVKYELFHQDLSQDCLELAPDFPETSPPSYNSNRVYPIVFGEVEHINPLRIGTDTEYKYHKAWISGAVGTDWHVYDDGVNIDSNVQDNSDGTFNLTSAPVGEVTLSGTGQYKTLIDVFDWAANRLSLQLDASNARLPFPEISYFLNNQRKIIDFLNDISAYFTHFFYIRNNAIFLVDMEKIINIKTITEFEYMPSEYTQDQPTKSINTTIKKAEAIEDNTGKHIKRSEENLSITADIGFGEDINIEAFESNREKISGTLTKIMSFLNRKRARLKMPYNKKAPQFGEKLVWADSSHIKELSAYILARNIQIDFINEEVIVEGEGDLA